jgi:hypothetical protein
VFSFVSSFQYARFRAHNGHVFGKRRRTGYEVSGPTSASMDGQGRKTTSEVLARSPLMKTPQELFRPEERLGFAVENEVDPFVVVQKTFALG